MMTQILVDTLFIKQVKDRYAKNSTSYFMDSVYCLFLSFYVFVTHISCLSCIKFKYSQGRLKKKKYFPA